MSTEPGTTRGASRVMVKRTIGMSVQQVEEGAGPACIITLESQQMLKRIRTEDVAPGMFLHKLEGAWFSHPFWRKKFLLEDEEQVARLKATGVEWVHIDMSLSRPAEPQRKPGAPANDDSQRRAQILRRARENDLYVDRAAGVRPAPPPPPVRSTAHVALSAEISAAANVARRSQTIVRDLVSQVRQGKAIGRGALEPVVNDIMASVERHPHAFTGILRLMKTSDYLYRHALSVSALMMNLANQIRLHTAQVHEAGLAGLLMDVGMGHVPPELFHKEGVMNDAEYAIVRGHTTLARDFMGIGGDIPEEVLDVCLHHHERLDGSGYPDGLSGDQISLYVRMAAICDTFDAMTSRRPHSMGENPAIVMQKLSLDTDRLDGDLLEAFKRTVGVYPTGSLVRLESDQLAIVVDTDAQNPAAPKVRAFYAVAGNRMILPQDIDLARGSDAVVSAERPQDWPLPDWEKLSTKLYGRAVGLSA